MRKLDFVTYSEMPELTADDELLVEPLRRRGIAVAARVWDAPPAKNSGAESALLLRSCWNYHLKAETFLRWVAERKTRMWNSPAIVHWNIHKHYLAELAAGGVAIPRTLWLKAGAPLELQATLRQAGMREAVVKPAISASAYRTWRVKVEEAESLQGTASALVAESDILIQEFLPEVETEGEISLVFFSGKFSHAVRKLPKRGDFRTQEEHGASREGCVPTAEFLRDAERVLELTPGGAPLYARVDGVPVRGRLILMELEVLDPALFLKCSSGAADRFAEAIDRAFA